MPSESLKNQITPITAEALFNEIKDKQDRTELTYKVEGTLDREFYLQMLELDFEVLIVKTRDGSTYAIPGTALGTVRNGDLDNRGIKDLVLHLHNHPTGSAVPSKPDIDMRDTLDGADCVNLIVAKEGVAQYVGDSEFFEHLFKVYSDLPNKPWKEPTAEEVAAEVMFPDDPEDVAFTKDSISFKRFQQWILRETTSTEKNEIMRDYLQSLSPPKYMFFSWDEHAALDAIFAGANALKGDMD